MFVDKVTITLQAGDGGHGIIAWNREKFLPKGGPDGGNGGRGGSIFMVARKEISSLYDFRKSRKIVAKSGDNGGRANCSGKQGADIVLYVPIGTLVVENSTNSLIHEFTKHDEHILLCAGGKGGLGNSAFKTALRKAPYIATEGRKGELLDITLELKLLADVGLIGLPNAGKSTLIAKLTNVKAKIGHYPFTTLTPNIGAYGTHLIADIPGIIKDAHKNRGLGLKFLRHIERTKILLFILDITDDPYSKLLMLQNELVKYNPALLKKKICVVLNKSDLLTADEAALIKTKIAHPTVVVSAKNSTHLTDLTDLLDRMLTTNFHEEDHSDIGALIEAVSAIKMQCAIMARTGIEPATQGFSVLCSTD